MFPFQTRTALTQSYTGRLLHPLATASETVATYTQKLPQNTTYQQTHNKLPLSPASQTHNEYTK